MFGSKIFCHFFSKLETILLGTSLVGDITQKTEARILSFGEKLSSQLMVQALYQLKLPILEWKQKKLLKPRVNISKQM